MTQVWTADGKVFPVTVLEVPVNKVSLLRILEKDGYAATQLEVKVGKNLKKRESRISQNAEPGETLKVGSEVKAEMFEPGEIVDISGTSKGRGFAGAVKRHGFHGAPASHGHDHPRAVGAIGQRFPQHVRPGLRMAGHMGARRATVKHSVIVAVDRERNLLFVKGGVPGALGTLLKITASGKKKEIGQIAEYGKTN